MHHGQDFDCGRRNTVGDNVWNVRQNQFVRAFDTTVPAYGRISREMIGSGDYAGDDPAGGIRIVSLDIATYLVQSS
jgi:hypothetical protein